jgi:hypothetical protein
VVSGKNEAIEVNCFALDVMRQDQLGHPINTEILQDDLGLVVVEITYVTFNTEKLVADFSKNFPNARKETKHEKVELLPLYPGAFIEYDKPVFSDVNQERRATLTLSPEKITTTFAPSSTLSESDKTLVLEQVKKQKPDAPTVVFASKRILDLHMNNFRKAIAAADQAKKDKAKKAAESSSGF